MISSEEALRIILGAVRPTTNADLAPLSQAEGGVLAQDALADSDIPPFNRATQDGYAVIAGDGPGEYEVVEDIPAGRFPQVRLTSGKVCKIMTGAPLPEGADAVVPVERTGGFAHVGRMARIDIEVSKGANISPRGEDMKKGAVALPRGTVIRPPEVAILAAVGADPVRMFRRPSVAILATGDELVDPASNPGPGQIRNSNGPATAAHVASMGLMAENLGTAPDEAVELERKIRLGMERDFLIISGGVSAGDRDLVPEILARCSCEILFHKVRIKPGKPTLFARTPSGGYVFGAPGNPVSSMVIFELFIRPALLAFWGAPHGVMEVEAALAGGFKRKTADREEYLPARLVWGRGGFTANLIEYHGSGHFTALAGANGLVKIPAGVHEAPKGALASARFLGGRITPI